MIKEYLNKFKVSEEFKNTIYARTNTFAGRFFNYLTAFLIIISFIVLTLSSFEEISTKYFLQIYIIDFTINSIFLFDYFYRWSNSTHKLEFPLRLLNIFSVLAFLPFFTLSAIYGIGAYSIFSIFRIFRLFSIFELVERNPILSRIMQGIKGHKLEYISVIFITFILVFFLSTLVYFIEYNWGNKEDFYSIPHTLWWALVTTTTTGYGDVVPLTVAGKSLGVILMTLGPILIAVIGSITIVVFLNLNENNSIEGKDCPRCEARNGRNFNYCKDCGKKFKV